MTYGVTEVFIKHDYYSGLRVNLLKKKGKDTYILLRDEVEYFKEIKEITTTKKIYKAPINFLTTPHDFELYYIYDNLEHNIPRYKYIKHEGSSRSSKSWSIEEWCIRQCEEIKNLRINVWRDTRTSLGDSVWKDFRKLFPLSGRTYKFAKNTIPIFFNNGSMIEPHGDDTTNAHGITQDIAWLNEPYKMSKDTFDQIDQRCEQMILDLNPKMRHWSDDLSKHPRCKTIHSTFNLNPFCPPEQKRKIMSYDPSNPVNIANGTEDQYKWDVYGLGLKAEKPNKIYKGWERMSLEAYNMLPYNDYFGLDFGKTNPTAMTGIKFNGKDEIYINPMLYEPMQSMYDRNTTLAKVLDLLIEKKDILVVDPADKESRLDLVRNGFNVIMAKKGAGSVEGGIGIVQKFKIYYVWESLPKGKDTKMTIYEAFEYEYDNYEWEIVKGVNLDRPLKMDDHYLDGTRYVITWVCKYLGIK